MFLFLCVYTFKSVQLTFMSQYLLCCWVVGGSPMSVSPQWLNVSGWLLPPSRSVLYLWLVGAGSKCPETLPLLNHLFCSSAKTDCRVGLSICVHLVEISSYILNWSCQKSFNLMRCVKFNLFGWSTHACVWAGRGHKRKEQHSSVLFSDFGLASDWVSGLSRTITTWQRAESWPRQRLWPEREARSCVRTTKHTT